MSRMTVATVNAAVKKLGHPERLRKGKGYYYWTEGETHMWYTSSVGVCHIDQLPLQWWLDTLDEMRKTDGYRPHYLSERYCSPE